MRIFHYSQCGLYFQVERQQKKEEFSPQCNMQLICLSVSAP
jgi:hypothetical protein